MAEHSRPSQLQPAQPHLQAVHRVGWNWLIVREQTHRRVTLSVLLEPLQRFPPRCLLPVVDLAQIQNGPLCRLPAQQTPILYDAEVAMILPILLAVCSAQKHRNRSMPELISFEKRVGLHSSVFTTAVPHPLDLPIPDLAKLPRATQGALAAYS